MYRKLLSLVVCAGAAIVFAAAGKPATVAAASTAPLVKAAESFWRCTSGYAFEVSGSASVALSRRAAIVTGAVCAPPRVVGGSSAALRNSVPAR